MLKTSSSPSVGRPQPLGHGVFRLAQPVIAPARSYRGEALRPFGHPLYRPRKHSSPVTLQALRRRPRAKKLRRRVRHHASYFLRKETPFAEQPMARATAPVLAKLRPH